MAQANILYKGEEKKFAIGIEAAGFDMDTDDFDVEVSNGKESFLVHKTGNPTEAGIWANEDGSLVTFYEEEPVPEAHSVVGINDYDGDSGYVIAENAPQNVYYYDKDQATATIDHEAQVGEVYLMGTSMGSHYFRFDGTDWVDIGTSYSTPKHWFCIIDTQYFNSTGQLNVIATAYITDPKAYDGVRKCIDLGSLGTLKNK
jgi:hypothetical protein